MINILELGKLDIELLRCEFTDIRTAEIIVTKERIEHIRQRHPEDVELFEKYRLEIIEKPNFIIKDGKNKGSILMIRKLENTNLNVVIRLNLSDDNPNYKNSIMTFYRVRDKNLKKLIEKNKLIYKSDDLL